MALLIDIRSEGWLTDQQLRDDLHRMLLLGGRHRRAGHLQEDLPARTAHLQNLGLEHAP